jgi:hypothetical protein
VKVIVTVTVIIGVIFIGISTYFLWRRMAKQKGNMHIPFHLENSLDNSVDYEMLPCTFLRTYY